MSSIAAQRTRKPFHWFARLPLAARMGLAAGAGAIGALGQAPYDQPLAMLLALTVAFVMFRRTGPRAQAAWIGWAFGVGYFALALAWIVEPFQIDPERYGWMAPFALLFISTGLALFWGLAFWGARYLSPRAWPLILTWTAVELLRAYVFTGFPWASPAQVLVEGMAGRGLAWGGPHGATLWLMSLAWALSFPAIHLHRHVMRGAQAGLLVSVAALISLPVSRPASELTPHWVRLVQPNADQQLKWQPDLARLFYERQLTLSAAPPVAGTPAPALTIWPETAIPWVLDQAAPILPQIAASAPGGPVVLGVLRFEGDRLFNSLAVLDQAGDVAQLYDKHHLVPFGEYIPFSDLAARIGLRGLAQTMGSGFAAGPGPRLLDFGALGKGLPLICYEAVFAHDVFSAPARPDFLLQITNDAWFGQDAGPQQHLAQARMRAIEQGLPLMRAANTGISAMIDPLGRITHSLALGLEGFIDSPLPRPLAPTLYSRTEDWPVAIVVMLGLVFAFSRRRRSGPRKPGPRK